jgi:hypothetical protein
MYLRQNDDIIYKKICEIYKNINIMHGTHSRMISIFRKRQKHKYLNTKMIIGINNETLSCMATEHAQKLVLYKLRCAHKIKLQIQKINDLILTGV